MSTRRPRIDLVREGVPSDNHREIFGALVSTAMWAMQRGYTETDWCGLLAETGPRGSRLGRQARLKRDGTEDTPKRTRDRLSKAWESAATKVADSPRWTREQAADEARSVAQAVRDHVANADADITETERTILAVVTRIATERGSDRLTLPTGNIYAVGHRDYPEGHRTGLCLETGLGLTALRNGLKRLDRRGLLVLVEAGSPRTKGRPPRANVYRLTRPNTGNGVAMPLALISDAPSPSRHDAPRSISDAPVSERQEGHPMDEQITLSREDIVAALGEAAYVKLLAARPPPKPCAIPREHEPHRYGPMTSSGDLAHECPGASARLRVLGGDG